MTKVLVLFRKCGCENRQAAQCRRQPEVRNSVSNNLGHWLRPTSTSRRRIKATQRPATILRNPMLLKFIWKKWNLKRLWLTLNSGLNPYRLENQMEPTRWNSKIQLLIYTQYDGSWSIDVIMPNYNILRRTHKSSRACGKIKDKSRSCFCPQQHFFFFKETFNYGY